MVLQDRLSDIIVINRAPVLSLWCTVVARQQGFSDEVSLKAGRAISSFLARSKGQRLGIFRPSENALTRSSSKRLFIAGFVISIEALEATPSAGEIKTYFKKAFGHSLDDVFTRFVKLAAVTPDIEKKAYKIYEKFRPSVDAGIDGWAQKGLLDLKIIDRLISNSS